MTPEQQAQFFTLLVITIGISAFLALLYYGRARLLPGIPYPSEQLPWFGLFISVQRHLDRISFWKNSVMMATIATVRKRRMTQLLKEGHTDLAEIEKLTKTPELLQWSIPFSVPFVEVISARNMKWMLCDGIENFEKGWMFTEAFQETLGRGIFNVDGDEWRKQRKVASHLFSFSKLNHYMYETFSSEAERVLAHLRKRAHSGEEFDFQQLMYEYTFDSICRIAFGKPMDTIGSKVLHPFCRSFEFLQSTSSERALLPFVFWKSQRVLNVGREKEFRQHLKTVNEFVFDMIEERKKNLDEYEKSGDLLSLFLLDAKERGETLSDVHIRDLILNFMIAGRDTTASALSWMFHFFSSHRDIETKCLEEIRRTIDPNTTPTPDMIRSLTYLEATFLETVRLRPPVPVDLKLCVKTTKFPSGEVVPKGTYCVFTPFLLNVLPEWYEGCTTLKGWTKDCAEFKPERWLIPDPESPGKMKVLNPPAHEFVTFNAGPRLCLGRSMAILEGKTLAASILETFKIQVRLDFQPLQRLAPVLAIAPSLPVKVTFRK